MTDPKKKEEAESSLFKKRLKEDFDYIKRLSNWCEAQEGAQCSLFRAKRCKRKPKLDKNYNFRGRFPVKIHGFRGV